MTKAHPLKSIKKPSLNSKGYYMGKWGLHYRGKDWKYWLTEHQRFTRWRARANPLMVVGLAGNRVNVAKNKLEKKFWRENLVV